MRPRLWRRKSHLLQMRGLKRRLGQVRTNYNVASFTDAWIETGWLAYLVDGLLVASFTDAWIETSYLPVVRSRLHRRIFYRCVD